MNKDLYTADECIDEAHKLMWETFPPFPYSEIEYLLLRSIALSLSGIHDKLIESTREAIR